MTDVRVGIVSYRTPDLLAACLQALPAALDGLDAEVVVVDNASGDESPQVAAAHGAQVVVNAANVGYARAVNQALAGTGARALCALNPDALPAAGSLRRLVDRLDAEPDVGCVVPRLTGPDGTLQHSVHRFPSVTTALVMGLLPPPLRHGPLGGRFWLEGYADHDRPVDVDWAIGAVHCLRAAAVADGPVYDERWFMYAEDMDRCWRLHQQGWRVVLEPSAEVQHVGNAAGVVSFGAGREARWLDATYDWYVRVHGVAGARRLARAHLLGLGVKAAVLAGPWVRDDAARERVATLRGFHRLRARDPRTTGLSLVPPVGAGAP